MASLKEEINGFLLSQIFPNEHYLTLARFTKVYQDLSSFGFGVMKPFYEIAMEVLNTCFYGILAAWSCLRFIGNLLILKGKDSLNALHDVGVHCTLSVAIALMAPVNLFFSTFELLTRTVKTWISPENTADLSTDSWVTKFLHHKAQEDFLLPSPHYLSKVQKSSGFFSPYKNSKQFFQGVTTPLHKLMATSMESLLHVAKTLYSAFKCLGHCFLLHPRHALDSAKDVSIHFSLAVMLALMAPVNVLVESAACITRLGATWVSKCCDTEDEDVYDFENHSLGR